VANFMHMAVTHLIPAAFFKIIMVELGLADQFD
jgi:hypothetical protein